MSTEDKKIDYEFSRLGLSSTVDELWVTVMKTLPGIDCYLRL